MLCFWLILCLVQDADLCLEVDGGEGRGRARAWGRGLHLNSVSQNI